MSKLRPYQSTAVAGIEQAWADGKKRPLLVAGTGAGKTEMAAALLSKARSPAAIVPVATAIVDVGAPVGPE